MQKWSMCRVVGCKIMSDVVGVVLVLDIELFRRECGDKERN